MNSMLKNALLSVALLLVLTQFNQLAYAINYNLYSTNCSNQCSQKDPTPACFIQSIKYFDKEFIRTARNWVIVNVDLNQWIRRNGTHHEGPAPTPQPAFPTNQTLTDTMGRWRKRLRSVNEFLNETILADLAGVLIKAAANRSSVELVAPPPFQCPAPCSYTTNLWQYLAVASIALNVLLFLAIIPFIIRMERRARQDNPDDKRKLTSGNMNNKHADNEDQSPGGSSSRARERNNLH